MILRLVSYAIVTELLYVALAMRSNVPTSATFLASRLRPVLFEETAEFLILWVALGIFYGLSVRAVSGREGRTLFGFIFLTSALFRVAVLTGSGFDQSTPSVFLDASNPIDWLSQSIPALTVGEPLLSKGVSLRAILASTADLAALALAPGLLRAAGLPVGLALIHGWNPLVVKEVAGSGRIDLLAFFLLLVSFRLVQRKWSFAAALAYGLSLSGPLMVAASLPVMARALGYRVLLALAVGAAAWTYAAPADSLSVALGYPPDSFLGGSLTPSLIAVSRLVLTREALVPLGLACAIFLFVGLLAASRLSPDLGKLPVFGLACLSSFLFLAPQVLPWRFSVVAYLAPFTRNRGFLVFTLLAPLSYLALGDGEWNFWLGFTQYFPAYASLVFVWLGGEK